MLLRKEKPFKVPEGRFYGLVTSMAVPGAGVWAVDRGWLQRESPWALWMADGAVRTDRA